MRTACAWPMTSSICEVELCKYPRSRSSCAVVPPWTWILWWAGGAPQRAVSCGCQAAGHGCNLAHPVNGLMPLPSPPRAPVANMRVSDAHARDAVVNRSHLPTAWRAPYLLPSCSSGDETPAQARVSSCPAQAQPPAEHPSRACVNSSRMSLCLASVWALASPVLVTVLFGGRASANSSPGKGPALHDVHAPAHGVVHVRQALQQGLNLLPLGTHNLWRAASATRAARACQARRSHTCSALSPASAFLSEPERGGRQWQLVAATHPLNAPSFEKLARRLSTSPSSFRAWALRVSRAAQDRAGEAASSPPCEARPRAPKRSHRLRLPRVQPA